MLNAKLIIGRLSGRVMGNGPHHCLHGYITHIGQRGVCVFSWVLRAGETLAKKNTLVPGQSK